MSVHLLVSRRLKLSLLALALVLVPAAQALASLDKPVRDVDEFNEPRAEKTVRLKGVSVVVADYALIRKDFSETAQMTPEQIDQWLIEQVGFIADSQTEKNEVNTKIPVVSGSRDAVTKKAYRPKYYNRALVFPVGEGFIDVKGAGSLFPQQVSHGNGLATTYEALREFIFEKKVQQIFSDAKVSNRTVGCYAVLDYGFKIIHRDGEKSPAGAILRQAHTRDAEAIFQYGNTFLEPKKAKKLELVLRRYGLSSSGEGTWRTWGRQQMERDVINLQGNEKGEIVDFGPYRVRDHFDLDTYFYGDITDPNAKPLMTTKDHAFLQPDPHVALSVSEWGRLPNPEYGLKDEVIARQIREVIDDFRAEKISRQEINDFIVSKLGNGNYPLAQLYRQKVPMSCKNVHRY